MSNAARPGYRIAGRMSSADLTVVGAQSQFARAIRAVFEQARPRRIIETGTYRGEGTTTAIAAALRDLELDDAAFHSIEVNPQHLDRASDNLIRAGLRDRVRLHNGLSVPRALLPTVRQIDEALVRNVEADQLVVDHEPETRARLYFAETDFPELPDDVLGSLIDGFDGRPDFILLDSGGHMGFAEFTYVIERLRGQCVIALDDVNHVKHHRSVAQVRADARFEVIEEGDEKFGFCVARFRPADATTAAAENGRFVEGLTVRKAA